MQKRFQMIGCLIVIVLVVSALIFSTAPKSDDTTNTILAAKRACDAQTGQNCSVP
jgi:hypothetical protein